MSSPPFEPCIHSDTGSRGGLVLCTNLELEIPGTQRIIRPEYRVRLGRFSDTIWIVKFGWYAYVGNREVCGWYLVNQADPSQRKPFSRPDLDDCYFVEI